MCAPTVRLPNQGRGAGGVRRKARGVFKELCAKTLHPFIVWGGGGGGHRAVWQLARDHTACS